MKNGGLFNSFVKRDSIKSFPFYKVLSELEASTVIPLMALLVTLTLFGFASLYAYQYEIELAKKSASDELSIVSNRIEFSINQLLDRAQGLAAYSQENPDASFEQLTRFSETLFSSQESFLRTIVLTKDTTVAFIYPLKGNESVLGVDLTTVQNQKDAVLEAKNTRRTVITQPVKLIQGDMGIICRVPLMTYENGLPKDFRGLLNVIINYDRLLGNSGLLDATDRYQLNINDTDDGDQMSLNVFESTSKPLIDPIEIPIVLRDSSWTLKAAPLQGWVVKAFYFYFILGIGVLFSVMVFSYLRALLKSKSNLRQMVAERTEELTNTNLYLEESIATVEEKQAELELLNAKLENSLEELTYTQEQLIQSEKLAALGELVAGVAHEINTPLGVGITLTSFLMERQEQLYSLYQTNQLTKTEMGEYFRSSSEAMKVMDSSLNRAAEIVQSFKTVAVEQATLELSSFNLKNYINDVLINLRPKTKTTHHDIRLVCRDDLEVTSYPGAISHILTNLILNSLKHGFDGIDAGCITIIVEKTESTLHLIYADDGIGIPKDLQAKVFNPFFTTKRNAGGTGLGLHIVHNMVTQILKGRIHMNSSPGNGVEFSIYFPDLKGENKSMND